MAKPRHIFSLSLVMHFHVAQHSQTHSTIFTARPVWRMRGTSKMRILISSRISLKILPAHVHILKVQHPKFGNRADTPWTASSVLRALAAPLAGALASSRRRIPMFKYTVLTHQGLVYTASFKEVSFRRDPLHRQPRGSHLTKEIVW